jgi:dihydrofolate reductase
LAGQVILFIAVSLDGYIARSDGSIEWLNQIPGEGDNGFGAFYRMIDTMVMGRSTYDHLLTLVKEFPHADKRCYVFSRSRHGRDENVQFVNENVADFTRRLLREGSQVWLAGGGQLAEAFLKANLVDRMIITVAPSILGEGIPLFPGVHPEAHLCLQETRRHGQFVQMHYDVRRNGQVY